jgi:hypothetical protein
VDKLDLLRHRLSLRIDEREAEGGGEEVRRSAIEVRMPFRRNPRDAIARADP